MADWDRYGGGGSGGDFSWRRLEWSATVVAVAEIGHRPSGRRRWRLGGWAAAAAGANGRGPKETMVRSIDIARWGLLPEPVEMICVAASAPCSPAGCAAASGASGRLLMRTRRQVLSEAQFCSWRR